MAAIQKGKRRRRVKRFKKRKDAVAYQKQALHEVQNRDFIPPSKKTVKDCAEEWFKERFADDSYQRSTRVERHGHVSNYLVPAFGYMPVQNLSVARIEQEVAKWRDEKKASPLLINTVLRTLTNILAEAKRHHLIKDNPGKEAKRLKPKQAKGPKEIFTAEELKRFIEATEQGSRERAIFMTLALTGCRVGEILGASWSAIDFEKGKFHICAGLVDPDPGESPPIKGPKNSSSDRTVPLPKALVHELKLWKLKCPPSDTDQDLVIVSDRGKPVRRNVPALLVKRILKDLKIEKRLTPHSFRHTFASLLLANKRPVPEVSRLLGHKNAQITYSTYAHHVPGEETEAVQNLAESILS